MGFACILRGWAIASEIILAVRHKLEVPEIHACPRPTEMIQRLTDIAFALAGQPSNYGFPEPAMGINSLTLTPSNAKTTVSAVIA